MQKPLREEYRKVLVEIYNSLIKKKEGISVHKLAKDLGIDWDTLAADIKYLNDTGYIIAKFMSGNPASEIADVRILEITPLGRDAIEDS